MLCCMRIHTYIHIYYTHTHISALSILIYFILGVMNKLQLSKFLEQLSQPADSLHDFQLKLLETSFFLNEKREKEISKRMARKCLS